MQLSIIIVNYNVRYFLEQCLHSVMKAIARLEAEVLVVDNHSADQSIDYLQPLFPSVRFIGSDTNLGFARANNLALQQAAGKHVLFLNPDTIVPEDCFEKCLGSLASNPTAGAVGVRMLDGSGVFLPESKRSFPTVGTAFFKLSGLAARFPKSPVLNRYALGHLDDRLNHSVDVLAGAFMMFRKSVLEQLGGFDEAFFMYGEDIDLSFRCKRAGFDNWYIATSSIIHFKGESAKKGSDRHTRMFYQAMITFVNKHYAGKGAALFRMLLNTGIVLKGVTSWLGNRMRREKSLPPVAQFLVLGDTADLQRCQLMLQKEAVPVIRVTADELPSYYQTQSCLVFCSSTLSYQSMIALMQQLPRHFRYRFHASGSNSIAGSDRSEGVGEVFTLNAG